MGQQDVSLLSQLQRAVRGGTASRTLRWTRPSDSIGETGRGVEWIIVTDKQDDGMSEAFSRIAAMEVSVMMDVPRVEGRVRLGHVSCASLRSGVGSDTARHWCGLRGHQ